MPRTRSYGYWLKGREKMFSFRLEVYSEAHTLFNDRLRINKRRKNSITFSIEEIIKWAKQRIGTPRMTTSTFIGIIKKEVGESSQKIFDRIFELALERYHELETKGYGEVPRLLGRRVVAPSPRPKPKPKPRPRPERQAMQQPQKIAPSRPQYSNLITSQLEKLKGKIPKHLDGYIKIEYDEQAKTFIISIIKFVEHDDFMKIAKISKKYKGTYDQIKRRFVIPSESVF